MRKLVIAIISLMLGGSALAEPPQGYLVWIKGELGSKTSRKVYRMTLPEKSDVMALTSGEDVECQISPDGKWVAYAKSKLPDTDYHQFERWKLYLVSIHGVGDGREEIKIDDNGYWPSWGDDNVLYYSQVDDAHDQHTKIVKVTLDDRGEVTDRTVVMETHEHFSDIREVNECFLAPDGSWFAARTRGASSVTGVGAFAMNPPEFFLLAKAGSVGCMPYVAPDGQWGFIAGAEHGIRWGDAPHVQNRQEDQELIAPLVAGGLSYHPGISTDGEWVLAAHNDGQTDKEHNDGAYDVYLYKLTGKAVDAGEPLATGGFNGWPHLWVGEPTPPPPPPPIIDSFAPDSYTIISGEDVTLSWTVRFAESITINGVAVDPLELEGSQTHSPTQSTDYVMVAENTEGTATATVPITVNATAQAVVIDSFSVDPAEIEVGESSELTWSASNAQTLDINGQAVPPSGTMEVSPTETTEYVLTARGHQGPVAQSVEVTVKGIDDLLDDRGGCMCSTSNSPAWLALAALLLLVVRRRRT
jgi:MYXO-CTERM domain-containing protein